MAKRAASEISDDYGWSPWSNNFKLVKSALIYFRQTMNSADVIDDSWFDGPHAKVLVGPEKTCFMIHRTLLVHLSGYVSY